MDRRLYQTILVLLALAAGWPFGASVRANDELLGFVRSAVPLTYVDELHASVRRIVVLGGVVAGLLALVIGFIVARGFTRPITEMTRLPSSLRAVAVLIPNPADMEVLLCPVSKVS